MKLKILLALLAFAGAQVAHADLELKCTSSDISRLESHVVVHRSEGVYLYSVTNCQGAAHSNCEPYKDSGLISFEPEIGVYRSGLVDLIPIPTGYEYIDHRGTGLILVFDRCGTRLSAGGTNEKI